ncbi:ATPase [Gammaproteobacteria bacterium LSUCC0112]|nr:ATPase [Gammaproteobacteria bacterium LSUCC0112]
MEFVIGAAVLYILYILASAMHNSSASNRTNSIARAETHAEENHSASTRSAPAPSPARYEEDDEDDVFATFSIHTSFGREAEKSPNRNKGRWIDKNEQLTIHGRQISRGFFYFGGILNSLSGYGVEPSLVDEQRPALPRYELTGPSLHTDESLGYWPSYATLSKGCRAAYLDFLASDRTSPNTPIGYVFMYFYGLERRVIENRTNNVVNDQEFMDIFEEVLRLSNVFVENRSFRSYSANFLELMALFRPALLQHRTADIPETNNALSFKVKLATAVSKGIPVDADLALDWLKNTYEYSLKTPARRCEKEFRQLFRIRFNEKFSSGFLVKPNKTKLSLSYHSASSGISGVNLDLEELPDPSVLKAPINKLVPIAEQCTSELNSYSRYLGKEGTSKNDISALMLLPKILVNETTSPLIESFKLWAEQLIQNNKGQTTVRDFWSHTGMPLPKIIGKKDIDLLTNLATKAGIGIAPDQRFHLAKFKISDNIVLFAPGHGEFFEPSPAYLQVMLALRLGAIVATVDQTVKQNEELALNRLIEYDDKLSITEKNSLFAYSTWLLNSPINSAGLNTKIALLDKNQTDFLKKFIISIALADGRIDAVEIKQIEKLYTALGLDRSMVTIDIHQFTASHRVSVSSTSGSENSKEAFELDEGILAMHESYTSDAKTILENIFAIEDDPAPEQPSQSDNHQGSLSLAHKALFEELITKSIWARHDVHELCGKLNLMVDGAIETINDWAYEKVDAPVLDDDGNIYVDLEIVEELKG